MEFDFIKVNRPLDTPNINAQENFQNALFSLADRVVNEHYYEIPSKRISTGF